MKKTFILGILFALMSYFSINSVQAQYTQEESKEIIQSAIAKYKEKNYLGCISELELFNKTNPSSAVAWYYLGSAYMNIAMKDDARMAFEKVISLNTVPQLTSYAVQAQLCMDDVARCKYQDFSYHEIQKLRNDPTGFFDELLNAKPVVEIKDEHIVEIDKLIDGAYAGNVHPEAKAFIEQEKMKIQQSKMNANRIQPNPSPEPLPKRR